MIEQFLKNFQTKKLETIFFTKMKIFPRQLNILNALNSSHSMRMLVVIYVGTKSKVVFDVSILPIVSVKTGLISYGGIK